MAHPRTNTIFDMCHLILVVISPLIDKMQTKTFDHALLISHRLQASDWSRTSSVFLYKLLTRLSSNLVNTFSTEFLPFPGLWLVDQFPSISRPIADSTNLVGQLIMGLLFMLL